MARSIRPLRLLRRGVGYAVQGVGKGFNNAVRFAWPGKRRKVVSSSSKKKSSSQQIVPAASNWFALLDSAELPKELCGEKNASLKRCQTVVTVGSRHWGNWWDGRGLLKVKIYDFAIYADKKQTRLSRLSRAVRRSGFAALSDANFYRELRSSDDIDMSLMVKASRNLPIKIMAGEYERILKRRLKKVGGTSSDPALLTLLEIFDERALPTTIRTGGYVKKGTVLTFKRFKDGRLTALAEQEELGTVTSNHLCAALFDLYLGDSPVSRRAKAIAGHRVVDFVLDNGRNSMHEVDQAVQVGGRLNNPFSRSQSSQFAEVG